MFLKISRDKKLTDQNNLDYGFFHIVLMHDKKQRKLLFSRKRKPFFFFNALQTKINKKDA